MHITKLVIRSLRIVQREWLDTDSLDPESLQFACETLARAHAALSPLQVSEEGEEPVYLGLGWPEDMPGIQAGPSAQMVLGQYFAETPEPAGTVFYLQHRGSGPVYAVLPAGHDEDIPAPEETGSRETSVEEVLADLESIRSGDLAEKVARFDSMWEEALGSLPAVLQFGPADWGEEWDGFAMHMAAAILLEE